MRAAAARGGVGLRGVQLGGGLVLRALANQGPALRVAAHDGGHPGVCAATPWPHRRPMMAGTQPCYGPVVWSPSYQPLRPITRLSDQVLHFLVREIWAGEANY